MNNEASVPVQVAEEYSRIGDEHDIHDGGFIKLRTRTHDISSAENHIPDIRKLGADLDAAVQAAWPTRHQSRYSQVHTLLISWVDDDLGVWQEIVTLRTVFEERYHFQVEEYKIPNTHQPDRALKSIVIDFLNSHDGQGSLLIVYYAGHARRAPEANAAPLWCANRSRPEPVIASGGIQSMFEEANADVLLLYDCCYSAAVPVTGSAPKKHVVEVIAACGFETIAPLVDKHSFSKALTEILALRLESGPFSVGDLHARVVSKLKCWAPDLLTDSKGKFVENQDGRPLYEHQPRRTPIYTIVCETVPRRSILLAPMPRQDQSSGTSSDQDTPTSSLGEASQDAQSTTNCYPSRKRKRNVEDCGKSPQILLAVRLERDSIELNAWIEWIRNLPADGKNIHIEGKYDSFSTLLLLRMPVSVWDLMPKNSAYDFVGFVTSENLCAQTRFAANVSCSCRHPCTSCAGVQSQEDKRDDLSISGESDSLDEKVSGEVAQDSINKMDREMLKADNALSQAQMVPLRRTSSRLRIRSTSSSNSPISSSKPNVPVPGALNLDTALPTRPSDARGFSSGSPITATSLGRNSQNESSSPEAIGTDPSNKDVGQPGSSREAPSTTSRRSSRFKPNFKNRSGLLNSYSSTGKDDSVTEQVTAAKGNTSFYNAGLESAWQTTKAAKTQKLPKMTTRFSRLENRKSLR